MSKMTTEQFLSHLGIEVGEPFMLDGYKVYIKSICKSRLIELVVNDKCVKGLDIVHLSYLLDKEITPLPKYTLTEDEKAIVRLEFNYKPTYVYRDISKGLCIIDDNLNVICWIDDKLFKEIKVHEKVSLYELRKCL